MQSTFEKKEVLCQQVLDTVYTQINAKRKSINKAKAFIKDNHQEIQDYFFSLIKDKKDVVSKVQSTLKKNPLIKNVIERGDKYIGHYIEILNKPDNAKNETYKAPPKKASSPKQKAHSISRLKPSTKKKPGKSTTQKTTKLIKK